MTTLPPELAGAIAAAGTRLGRLGRRFEYFPTIGSTNDVASERSASGNHEGVVFVADAQTSGRGRRGRAWFSPPGAGLYVSTVLAPARSRDRERATLLTTGALDFLFESKVQKKRVETPELAIRYRAPRDTYYQRA